VNVGTYNVRDSGIDHNKITELLLGKKMTQVYPDRTRHATDEYLRLENLSVEGYYHDINLSAKKGEVLGIFGLVGSGFDELCKTIFGLMNPTSGKMFLNNKEVKITSSPDAIKKGIFLIPGDRRVQGQISEESVAFNITLSALDKVSTFLGLVHTGRERSAAKKIVNDLQIKTPSLNQKVGFLSGGNQQKVVIGKGFYADSDLYIFEEPTVGVDVGAKASIYKLIRELSKDKAVIVVSSDVEEVYGICDQAMVLFKGKVVMQKPIEQTRLDEMLLFGLTGELTGGKNGQ
jgi:ribose transport system ATP-binding protein